MNGKIAFFSNRDGNAEIYSMDPDGSALRRLTNDPATDLQPAWSPDGTKIAFFSTRDNPGGDIYVMNADGTGVRRVTVDQGPTASEPTWSPDGTKIAFSFKDQTLPGQPCFNQCIDIVNVDGTGLITVPTDTRLFEPSSPAWSPDGTKIAFSAEWCNPTCSNFQIWTIDPDGSALTRLTTDDDMLPHFGPNWSPDGTKIAFSELCQIAVMSADGSGQSYLTNPRPDCDGTPTWSPDGTKIAFEREVCGYAQTCIDVINSDGTGFTQLQSGSINGWPDWQPLFPTVHRNVIVPTTGTLTAGFSWSDKCKGDGKPKRCHSGLDIASAARNPTAPVYAALSGKVIRASCVSGYGWSVVIDHGDVLGNGQHLFGLYAHMGKGDGKRTPNDCQIANSSYLLVAADDFVAAGQQIGAQGNSGDAYGAHGGIHLHFSLSVAPAYAVYIGLIDPQRCIGLPPYAGGQIRDTGTCP